MGKFYEPLKNSKGKTDTLDKHMIYIVMDTQSMAARMSRVRGFKCLDQVEYMHLVTLNGLKVPDRKKEVYGGTNQGNVIGPVCMRPLEDGWTTTFAEKKLIFGKHRRAVGGTDPAAVGNEKPPSVNSGGASKDRNDDNIEPVFYRALPPQLLQLSVCQHVRQGCCRHHGRRRLRGARRPSPQEDVRGLHPNRGGALHCQ